MRIIAGEAKGRRLFAPGGEETRPTADRIREALFNILAARVPGARVLDLFGGTGALALEALSRGASEAVVVDSNVKAIASIRRNAQAVLGEAWEARVRVVRADYRKALERLSGGAGFDLIFLDPPYRMAAAYADALGRLRAMGLLRRDALAVLERSRTSEAGVPAGFRCVDARAYGETVVEFVVEGEDG